MDTILSTQDRTKKQKNNQENKIIQVVKACYIDGYKIEIEFNDSTVKTIDFGVFLQKHPHPQYNKYKNIVLFKQFKIEAGNLGWGKNWDLIFPVAELYNGRIQ